MTTSVADRVTHRMPRPVKCDACGSPRVALQSRKFMQMATYEKWPLVWHCEDCDAMVGCHEGTDIPFGLMADAPTRGARFLAHRSFDPLWQGKKRIFVSRAIAYAWLANALNLSPERAHIAMLDTTQCNAVIAAANELHRRNNEKRHWTQDKRKRRRK